MHYENSQFAHNEEQLRSAIQSLILATVCMIYNSERTHRSLREFNIVR